MKKVYVVVHYTRHDVVKYDIDDIYIITKQDGHFIHHSRALADEFDGFNNMYKFVLWILKQNNFECNHVHEFGRDFYDILWVNSKLPSSGDRYGYDEK